ncbi:hypothetical protein H0H93_011628 [Arthromyces matolae]|nr:hypothetical protein H0H93_011628 [Arthromyces matolae]
MLSMNAPFMQNAPNVNAPISSAGHLGLPPSAVPSNSMGNPMMLNNVGAPGGPQVQVQQRYMTGPGPNPDARHPQRPMMRQPGAGPPMGSGGPHMVGGVVGMGQPMGAFNPGMMNQMNQMNQPTGAMTVRRVASQPQMTPGGAGGPVGMAGNMGNMGIPPQMQRMPQGMGHQLQRMQMQQGIQGVGGVGVGVGGGGQMQNPMGVGVAPDMPMRQGVGGPAQRASATQQQLMNSLAQSPSMHQQFQNPVQHQHTPQISSPRPGSLPHTPNMGISVPGPSHTPVGVNRGGPPMNVNEDPMGFMNVSGFPTPTSQFPPGQHQHTPRMTPAANGLGGGGPFSPFVPSATPPLLSEGGSGGGPGTLSRSASFHLTPAQQYEQMNNNHGSPGPFPHFDVGMAPPGARPPSRLNPNSNVNPNAQTPQQNPQQQQLHQQQNSQNQNPQNVGPQQNAQQQPSGAHHSPSASDPMMGPPHPHPLPHPSLSSHPSGPHPHPSLPSHTPQHPQRPHSQPQRPPSTHPHPNQNPNPTTLTPRSANPPLPTSGPPMGMGIGMGVGGGMQRGGPVPISNVGGGGGMAPPMQPAGGMQGMNMMNMQIGPPRPPPSQTQPAAGPGGVAPGGIGSGSTSGMHTQPQPASSDTPPSSAGLLARQVSVTAPPPPPVGQGQGLIRLLQFSASLAAENNLEKLQLSWWSDLIKEYFTPKAIMKLTLWKDNQRNEAKPFDIGVPILPRFFLVTTQSGVKSMTLSIDGARERIYSAGHSTVECINAIWTYKYSNGYTVTLKGPLTVHVVVPLDALTKFSTKLREIQPFNINGLPPAVPNSAPTMMNGGPFTPMHTNLNSTAPSTPGGVTLYSSAPPSITNPSGHPHTPMTNHALTPTSGPTSSPKNPTNSASNSPQKQHKTIPGSQNQGSSGSGSTMNGASSSSGNPASSPNVSSGGTTNTPALSSASLKRKQGGDTASPSNNPEVQQPPLKRQTRRRRTTNAANAGGGG